MKLKGIKKLFKTEATEVIIGTQVWMSKNLDTRYYSNGDLIPLAMSAEDWNRGVDEECPMCICYDFNLTNIKEYGLL
jgi:hypothetical protein